MSIVNDKMSETPETDAEVGYFDLETAVSADFARRLERERNKAHEIAEQAIDDLAWFNETNSQRLRTELEQLKDEKN